MNSSSPTTSFVKGDHRLSKNINRMVVLRLLREQEGLSRADLADRSGLTRSTVSLLVKELIDEGWLREDDVPVTGQLGRRPTPLQLDGRRFVLVGAELTPDTIRVVATSIQGVVLERDQAPLQHADPERSCRQLATMVSALVRRAVGQGQAVLGIGVGLPGAVEPLTGVLQFAPNMGWRDVPAGRHLREQFDAAGLSDVPVHYQNEADLAAIGETEFGARPPADPLVHVSCGIGVGAGIVIDGTLFVGATGAGGEVGHSTVQQQGRACQCGRRGCAQAYVGLRAIAVDAGLGWPIDRKALDAALAVRDPRAIAAMHSAGKHLGVVLQNIWTSIAPRAIVLGGETVALGGDDFIDTALRTLADYAAAAGATAPHVQRARHTELAVAVGGAAYTLHLLMQPYRPLLQPQR